MKKIVCLLFWGLSLSNIVKSQNIYNSQFYSLPLFENPANTGSSNFNLRAGIDYRNQWCNKSKLFTSQLIYADVKLPCYLFQGSWFGLGLTFFNDKMGEAMKGTYGGISGTFHKGLTESNNWVFSIGANCMFVNNSLNYNELVFEDQINNGYSGEMLAGRDKLTSYSLWYKDLTMGVKLTYYKKKASYYIGVCVNHILQPSVSFYNLQNNLERSFAFDLGIKTGIFHDKCIMESALKVDMVNEEKYFNIGSNIYSKFNFSTKQLILGLWYRSTKQLIPTVGMEFENVKVIASYDFSLNSLYSKNGSIELSLTYTFGYLNPIDNLRRFNYLRPPRGNRRAIPCPKFKTGYR